MRSVVSRNVVTRRMTVYKLQMYDVTVGHVRVCTLGLVTWSDPVSQYGHTW